jgi:hypothetical protein
MESQDEDAGIEGDQRAAYRANQEYDDDGKYPDSYYAMSAAMEPQQRFDDENDQDSEMRVLVHANSHARAK